MIDGVGGEGDGAAITTLLVDGGEGDGLLLLSN